MSSEEVSIQNIRDNNSKLNAVTIKVKQVTLQEKIYYLVFVNDVSNAQTMGLKRI
jgi:hypothetical protein